MNPTRIKRLFYRYNGKFWVLLVMYLFLALFFYFRNQYTPQARNLAYLSIGYVTVFLLLLFFLQNDFRLWFLTAVSAMLGLSLVSVGLSLAEAEPVYGLGYLRMPGFWYQYIVINALPLLGTYLICREEIQKKLHNLSVELKSNLSDGRDYYTRWIFRGELDRELFEDMRRGGAPAPFFSRHLAVGPDDEPAGKIPTPREELEAWADHCFFLRSHGLEITGVLKSSLELGGDFYDVWYDEEGTLYLSLFDSLGHALPGSLHLPTIVDFLRHRNRMRGREPDGIMRQFHKFLGHHNRKLDLEVSIPSTFLKISEPRSVLVSNAGNPAPVSTIHLPHREKTSEVLLSPGETFGDAEFTAFKEEYVFKPGDLLLCATDGLVINLRNAGIDLNALLRSDDRTNSVELAHALMTAMDDSRPSGREYYQDDVAFFILQYRNEHGRNSEHYT